MISSPAVTAATPPLTTLARLASLVRLSHTIFGLPFALAAAGLAHRSALAHGGDGLTLPVNLEDALKDLATLGTKLGPVDAEGRRRAEGGEEQAATRQVRGRVRIHHGEETT